MIKEAIILAGGLGTRLREVVADRPKCMALINGKPFLHYLIKYLQEEGITHFIFSVGYLHEIIEDYLKSLLPAINYKISLEEEPLGTGGGIKLACKLAVNETIVVCNGDTMYKVNISELHAFHEYKNASCTLALKPMHDFDRYGAVELRDDQSIRSFKEKMFYKNGLINGGVYALDVKRFLSEDLPEKFSFEKDYLEKKTISLKNNSEIFGFVQDNYFIDIGIPEDYKRAEKEIR
jgi:D-glycero-alpha-D-manno-heptose 1-phosphate guanylyltransferase